ncbi:unnamed protein product [Triticum aestivum]|uniref:RNase H type-1 domain-containing protein n=1 Tax=Triticum aestivum TaxID=4565 RepID=A0A7H4LI06_WHEAT|nr:unnamed protein product [Triticum aestivum]
MHFDASKMRTGLGAGIVLTSPKGDKLRYVLQIHFSASNNIAEYEALIHGLRLAKELGIRQILCYGDSDLVVQQSSGDWDAKDANMASYRFLVQQLSGYFEGCEFLHVPRNDNEQADALARIGSTQQAIPTGVALQRLLKLSVKPSPESESIFVPAPPEAVGSDLRTPAAGTRNSASDPGTAAAAPGPGTAAVGPGTSSTQQVAADSNPPPPGPTALVQVAVLAIEEIAAPSWAKPILNFLVNKELPTDEISGWQVQRRAAAYTIVNRELVRRSVTGVYQRCVEPEQGQAILKDIHQGECGHHTASRALVAKAFHHDFFWPTALEDAKDLVQKCKGCQKFRSQPHQPACALKTIPIAWPFAVWGLDMVGPFKTARAVIPTDIEFDSPRITMYTEEEAEEARQDDVDLLEEGRLLALSRSTIYHQNLRRYYNRKVKPRSFQEGDLVLRLIQRTAGKHKLLAPCEGPFIISKVLGNDSYYLIDAQKPRARKRDDYGKETERPWNANLLRRIYS